MTFYKTLSSREQRFSLKAFKFTGMYPKVFFHCRVTVCNTSDSTAECARDCSTKSRDRTRRSAGGPVYRLAKGPIIFTPGIVSLAITRNDGKEITFFCPDKRIFFCPVLKRFDSVLAPGFMNSEFPWSSNPVYQVSS